MNVIHSIIGVLLVGNLMRGTAIQHGERTEMKWSLFNKLSARLKGMGKAARYAAIDYWWNGENLRQDVRSLLPGVHFTDGILFSRKCAFLCSGRLRVASYLSDY